MEEIFSKKAWCKPIAVASSTGLSIKNTNLDESNATLSTFSNNSDQDIKNK